MKKNLIKTGKLMQDKQAMTDRLEAMRKDAGIAEARILQFTCSRTGTEFAVRLERENESDRFQIVSIDHGKEKGGSMLQKLFGKTEKPAQKFAASEFDFTGFACPHCGHNRMPGKAAYFGCGCGRLQCGATIKRVNGVLLSTCGPPCNHTGPLESIMVRLDGSEDTGTIARHPKLITAPRKQITRR